MLTDGFQRLYAFFIEHQPCPDPHIVTKRRRAGDGESWQVEAMCPGCGGSVILEISASEEDEALGGVFSRAGQSSRLQ